MIVWSMFWCRYCIWSAIIEGIASASALLILKPFCEYVLSFVVRPMVSKCYDYVNEKHLSNSDNLNLEYLDVQTSGSQTGSLLALC